MHAISCTIERMNLWFKKKRKKKLVGVPREACLPPLLCLVRHQHRLTGLRLICCPPQVNLATAHLPRTVPTFSSFRALRLVQKKITSRPYIFFNLSWDCPPDKIMNPRYRHNALSALTFMASPLFSDVVTLPLIFLHLMEYLPPAPPVVPSYNRLKAPAKQHLLEDWGSDPAPGYCPYPPATHPHLFIALGKFLAGRINQMRSGRSYVAVHISWESPNPDTTCTCCSGAPQSFEHPSSPAPRQPGRDPTSTKGLQISAQRPCSGRTSKCSSALLSLFMSLLQAALWGCHLSHLRSTPRHQTLVSTSLSYLPRVLESGFAVRTCLLLAYAALRQILVALGDTGYVCFFCGLLFDFRFCFGHIDKMHAIFCTVETMNISFKNKIK